MTHHQANELLDCPHCGNEAVKTSQSGDERDGYAQRVQISCIVCGARIGTMGDTSKGGYADNSTVEARAIAAWNRRAAPASEPALIGAEVSMDVSTSDADAEQRIFGRVEEVMTGAGGELVLLAVEESRNFTSEPAARDAATYICIGKGGDYRYLGGAVGAGGARDLPEMAVYQEIATGKLYFRTHEDFAERMAMTATPTAPESSAPAMLKLLRAAERGESDAQALNTKPVDVQNSSNVDHKPPPLAATDEPAPRRSMSMFATLADYKAAQATEQGVQGAQASPWISVEDRLPEPEVDVLCYGPSSVSATMPWLMFVDWFGAKKDAGRGVTHWTPLPPRPAAVGLLVEEAKKMEGAG